MIVLNFGPPITRTQKAQIAASVAAYLDPQFRVTPEVDVIDVEDRSSAKATFDAVDVNWQHEAIAHRIPAEHPIRDALLYEIERRCGYSHVEIRGKRK